MNYIDKTFYDNYSDISISADEFNILLNRAEDIVNILTRDLQGVDFESLPLIIQEKVKKAVGAQIETLYQNGGTESLTGENLASANIGKFSYSENSNTNSSIPISPMVKMYLGSTGLLYRGNGVITYE